jgi:hypothetical protein
MEATPKPKTSQYIHPPYDKPFIHNHRNAADQIFKAYGKDKLIH